ncbi:hypothetical protein A4D02_35295 [Niastella koreensis]|uniref:Transcriptional regulator, TetR family n=2 Tax=Niastella koreensis TaxID=354356 RepID=G8TBT1_NIAKG|nr:TetR/AcrR family transcriptional regulator [Niastella koreensis]AEV98213.1 transcriptional regulator, TetR family [Niastella koreensis GR20-10]OQP44322.1 hypothetical protein A4D02_35295 [Niastella koreensis]
MSKAKATRADLLQKAFELIYQNGYQATSIDEMLATTGVTKGALYYHFKNKEEMGLAIIDEVIYNEVFPFIKAKLEESDDVRENLYNMMSGLLLKHSFFKVEYGCPAVNLMSEMAPVNELFRKTLKKQFSAWQKAIEQAIVKGQETGQLALTHNAKQIALYILAGYQGARNMGKLYGRSSYGLFLDEFKNYLYQLK